MKGFLLLMLVWILGGGVFTFMGCPEGLALLLGLVAPIALVVWATKNSDK